MSGKQTSLSYGGYEIVQRPYTGTHDKIESMGFTVDTAYVVTDEFGDFALPLVQQWFWTPSDAKAAIDAVNSFKPRDKHQSARHSMAGIAHRFTQAIAHRLNFMAVFLAIEKIRKECVMARDFDDNPREAIEKILGDLATKIEEKKP